MNKKAILMSEVLRIILAVLGIVILMSLAVGLYGIFIKSDLDKVRIHMDNIERIVNNLKEGESENYVLLNPKEWVLTTWPIDYARETYILPTAPAPDRYTSDVYTDTDMPNECKKNNWQRCICFCSPVSNRELIEACNKLSVCKNINSDLEKNKPVNIEDLIRNKQVVNFILQNNKIVMSAK